MGPPPRTRPGLRRTPKDERTRSDDPEPRGDRAGRSPGPLGSRRSRGLRRRSGPRTRCGGPRRLGWRGTSRPGTSARSVRRAPHGSPPRPRTRRPPRLPEPPREATWAGRGWVPSAGALPRCSRRRLLRDRASWFLLECGGWGLLSETGPPHVGDLAERASGPDRLQDGRHDVGAAVGRLAELGERRLDHGPVAFATPAVEARDLLPLLGRSDPLGMDAGASGLGEEREPRVAFRELVDAHHDLLLPLPGPGDAVGLLRDLARNEPPLDRDERPSHLLDPVEVLSGLGLDPVGQVLDLVRTSERVDRVRDPRFLGEDLLRSQREPGRRLRREAERLVERVGVERLRTPEDRRERL